jgi:hypothetical protein
VLAVTSAIDKAYHFAVIVRRREELTDFLSFGGFRADRR